MRTMHSQLIVRLIVAIWFSTNIGIAAGIPKAECFPVETLSVAQRNMADQLLLQALDSDALFTIITGLKPMTTAYAQRFPESNSGLATHFQVKVGDLDRLRQLQRLQPALTCGEDITAGAAVMPATGPADFRIVWPYLANRNALRAAIAAKPNLYGRYWITEYTEPTAVLVMIGAIPRDNPDGARLFGYLFGYPEYAIDWYAEHGQPKSVSGEPLFGFVTIPAYEKGTAFAWTAPKEHTENELDHKLRERAELILQEYRKRRNRYIGPGNPGAAALLRDWFDDGHGKCAAANAVVPGLK